MLIEQPRLFQLAGMAGSVQKLDLR